MLCVYGIARNTASWLRMFQLVVVFDKFAPEPATAGAMFAQQSAMTPQQEQAEREIIFAMMMMMLRDLKNAGLSDWQTLTSFSRTAHGSG